MKKVSILIPEGDISLVNVEGLHHIFSETNKALTRAGKNHLFYFQLVGKRRSNFVKENFFSIHPNFLVEDDVKTDILIIPALHGNVANAVALNKDLVPWIVQQHRNGAEIISLCTGAFLLASTGLLDGKRCATHWIHAVEFKKMFPAVTLVEDQIMTDENGIYTSGAAYTYLNLMLYVLEKYVSREIVVFIAKIFAIDMGRSSQSQFMIFEGYKSHGDEYVLKVQEFIEKNYRQKISVQQLADYALLGKRNLERRFKAATALSIKEYMQRVKVEVAKKLLETGKKIVNEVSYEVGYTDTKSFRDVFKKVVGMSPTDYRSKYKRTIKKLETDTVLQ